MKYKVTLVLLSILFVVISFIPQLWDIHERTKIPKERTPDLVHNYLFDYNFYLSRVREGMEGRFLVTEKYFNHPHMPSLFQIVYIYIGKVGGIFGLSVEQAYHGSRFVFGLTLLLCVGFWMRKIFPRWWSIAAFLLITTSGSWPIVIKAGEVWRSATYMGWWSAVDSLQRIAFLPHVLAGQIFLVLFLFQYAKHSFRNRKHIVLWGILGFVCGILFPPTIIVIYMYFVIISLFDVVEMMGEKGMFKEKFHKLFWNTFFPRIVFVGFSVPSLLYLQIMMKVTPWSELALMDIRHRIGLPYKEYANAIGPVLPLGIAGIILAFIKQDKKMIPFISWCLTVVVLILIFERVPTQSPLRFTEAIVYVPLGALTTYLFINIAKLHKYLSRITGLVIAAQVLTGIFVMWSMVGWLTDQVYMKRIGTWSAPLGVQLVYPLKDFMDGIEFIRLQTKTNDIILTYITAGNYIPAYAGNYVYIGHINTPDEDVKERIAATFFQGKMKPEEAKAFFQKEKFAYVYYGPQERELAWIGDLRIAYPDLHLTPVYTNPRVVIYRVEK